MEFRPFLDVFSEGFTLPPGYDRWGLKTVDALRRTTNNFLWPAVGQTARAWGHSWFDLTRMTQQAQHVCPQMEGDGLSIARNLREMSSGGLDVHAVLLVAYRSSDVVASSLTKERTMGDVLVVAERLAAELPLSGISARWVEMRGAQLEEVNATESDFFSAAFAGIRAHGIDFSRSCLAHAHLHRAGLGRACFIDANLDSASFRGADLGWADFSHARLTDTTFAGANIYGARFRGLSRARVAEIKTTAENGDRAVFLDVTDDPGFDRGWDL